MNIEKRVCNFIHILDDTADIYLPETGFDDFGLFLDVYLRCSESTAKELSNFASFIPGKSRKFKGKVYQNFKIRLDKNGQIIF